ncbi:MAG: hypothetical protein HRU41_10110 [Saprospiraceae bacterium]|nr:hypothetical protein [Saprospiraceae bacterium]
MEKKELVKRWKGNQRYTLKLIEAMPEDNFNFKPIDGIKTFQSQCSHITTWLRTHSRFVTGEELPKINPKNKQETFQLHIPFHKQLSRTALP